MVKLGGKRLEFWRETGSWGTWSVYWAGGRLDGISVEETGGWDWPDNNKPKDKRYMVEVRGELTGRDEGYIRYVHFGTLRESKVWVLEYLEQNLKDLMMGMDHQGYNPLSTNDFP